MFNETCFTKYVIEEYENITKSGAQPAAPQMVPYLDVHRYVETLCTLYRKAHALIQIKQETRQHFIILQVNIIYFPY